MYNTATTVYGGGGQEHVTQGYYQQTPMNPAVLSMYGGAPMQMAPQGVGAYTAAPFGYGGMMAAPNTPPVQQGYYSAQQGTQAVVFHNSAMSQAPNMFVTGGNHGYFSVPFNTTSGVGASQNTMTMSAGPQRAAVMPTAPEGFQTMQHRGVGAAAAGGWAAVVGDPMANASHFEVHDTHLKTPIPVNPNVVVPTIGSERLFHPRGKESDAQRSRNMVRLCESFVEGTCTTGERCSDVHVRAEYVQAMRQQLSAWLMERERDFNNIRAATPDKAFRVFVADLKEVVDIPVSSLAFTKGLYVDPATRARRTRGVPSQGRGNVATAQVPTGCGLYSTDPANCKWGRWCNQVHIAKSWMNTRKQEFDEWFTKLEEHYVEMASEHIFIVHDPQSKLNLEIPKYAVSGFTRGLFQGSERKAPSVCLLFQRGRCTAAACCNQIHVDQSFLDIARQRAVYCNENGPEGQPVPSPTLSELDRQLKTLRESLLVKEAEEIRRLTEEAAQRRRESRQDTASDPAQPNTAQGEQQDSKQHFTESPTEAGLIEHIAVDDDDDDPAPLHLPHDRTARGAAAICRPDGSYTNNPYGSLTSLAEGHSAASSVLSLGGIVVTPSRISTSANGGVGGGVGVTVQQRSSSSFSRTPAASITAFNGGGKRGSNGKGRATHTYFDPHTDGSSLFFNTSSNSYSSPATGGGFPTANQTGPHGGDASGNGDGYYPGYSTHPQSTEDGSLHFSVSQLVGVNASTVSLPKSSAIAQQPGENTDPMHR